MLTSNVDLMLESETLRIWLQLGQPASPKVCESKSKFPFQTSDLISFGFIVSLRNSGLPLRIYALFFISGMGIFRKFPDTGNLLVNSLYKSLFSGNFSIFC